MKTSYLSFLVSSIFVVNLNHAQAQSNISDEQEKAVVKEFYTKYMTGMGNDLPEKELKAIQKQYCTPRLIKKIPKLADKIDQDPFLKTQDSNAELLKSLTIEKDSKDGHFIVSYQTNRRIVINLTVVKVNEGYKIDSVW